MDNIGRKILDALQDHIDDSSIKKISLSIDRNEIYEKYKSGEELNELEKYFIMPLMDSDEEMEELIDGNEILERAYKYAVKQYRDNVIRYKYNLMVESDNLNEEVFESKYMLSTHELYDVAYKVGFNDCLINIIDNVKKLDYSNEDIEKIIGQSIDEKLAEYENKRED